MGYAYFDSLIVFGFGRVKVILDFLCLGFREKRVGAVRFWVYGGACFIVVVELLVEALGWVGSSTRV